MMVERQLPKYLQLKQEIMAWLAAGELQPGAQMPSENEIAARYRISRQTVRQALGELEQAGWLYRVQGKGTFVSKPPAKAGAAEAPAPAVQAVGTISMMTTYISDYIFPHIVRGAEGTIRQRGFGLMLSSTDNDKARERDNLQLMLSQQVRGAIIEPTRSAQGNPNLDLYLALQVHNIPFVMINERYPELHSPCLKIDDEQAAYEAASYLIDLGHTYIAGFFKTDDLQGANRMKGFVRAHRDHRLPLLPGSVTHYATESALAHPYEAALAMLQQTQRPTALFCYNDELAVRLLEVARQLNLSVPRDLSVLGFDDSSLATATETKLTTVAHPKQQMGIDAANLLLDMIAGRQNDVAQDQIYRSELIIRESTGPCPR